MIDFRYHLVSLIAVFMAVALGIIIGTTQLNGPLTDNLQAQVTDLQTEKRALEDQTQSLQSQLDDVGSFEEAVGPTLVENTLSGRSVLLVVGAEEVDAGVVEGVTALLGSAGATVTGTVRLTEGYGDPATASSVQNYVTGPGRPPGVTPADTDDPGELVADLLAQVLMVPGAAGTAPDATATSSVLSGLEELEVLGTDTTSVTPAEFAVVLTAGAVSGDAADERTAAMLQLVSALDARGSGVVVAGDGASAGDGGLVGAVRGDQAITAAVSTVDNVTAAAGRISTVLAVAAEGSGTTGEYGTGEDAQPVPQLAG